MKWIFSVLLMLLVQSVSAATLSKLAFLYYEGQANHTKKSLSSKMGCEPDNGRPISCVKAVSSVLPPSSTDDSYEIKAIIDMCKSNANGGCFISAVRNMPNTSKDDVYEVKEILNHCSALQSGACVGVFSKYLSKTSIDDSYEVIDVIKKCVGISDDVADCADFSCSRQSSTSCDDSYEVVSVLRNCGARF